VREQVRVNKREQEGSMEDGMAKRQRFWENKTVHIGPHGKVHFEWSKAFEIKFAQGTISWNVPAQQPYPVTCLIYGQAPSPLIKILALEFFCLAQIIP
jgi:hypothetical protein